MFSQLTHQEVTQNCFTQQQPAQLSVQQLVQGLAKMTS